MFIIFKSAGVSSRIETAEWIELRGREMFVAHRLEPIARFEVTHWRYGDKRCSYVECRENLYVEFADHDRAGPVLGPFISARLRDCYLFAGRRCAAKLSSAGRWSRHGGNNDWSVVRIRSRGPATHAGLSSGEY